jgi:hypothetical protein
LFFRFVFPTIAHNRQPRKTAALFLNKKQQENARLLFTVCKLLLLLYLLFFKKLTDRVLTADRVNKKKVGNRSSDSGGTHNACIPLAKIKNSSKFGGQANRVMKEKAWMQINRNRGLSHHHDQVELMHIYMMVLLFVVCNLICVESSSEKVRHMLTHRQRDTKHSPEVDKHMNG